MWNNEKYCLMMNFDPKKMRDFLFKSPYYKHINVFFPALTSGFGIEEQLSDWISKEETLKFLYCMERLEPNDEFLTEEFETLLVEVRNHNRLKAEDWSTRTKGRSFLYVNGQFFVSESVALKIVLDFGGEEMRKILQSDFDAIYDEDKNYVRFFESSYIYKKINDDLKLLALHILAEEDRFWNSIIYARRDRNNVLYNRANGILDVLSNLL